MTYVPRALEAVLGRALRRKRSVLLLGPRQTGKTTLVGRMGADWTLSLVSPDTRQRYERDPALLRGEVVALRAQAPRRAPLVAIDEVQKVPLLLDVVQELIDRGVARFLLTGSSARKLRRTPGGNLLPGRVVALRLDPLGLTEWAPDSLEQALLYGSLPGVAAVPALRDRERDLASYVTTYLEEEVRSESLVRRLAPFGRFVELAAAESGQIANFSNLAREIGVSPPTIRAYYEILEDCLVVERIDPLTESGGRRRLVKSSRYLFFDLGVRRLAAGEGPRPPRDHFGRLFEQFVGLELVRSARLAGESVRVHFWRDVGGTEVDWVVGERGNCLPIEVKWTDAPTARDARHLRTFVKEYRAKAGYVVCRTPRPVALAPRITAVPWQDIPRLVAEIA